MISTRTPTLALAVLLLGSGLVNPSEAQTVRFGSDGGGTQVTTFAEYPGPFLVGLVADDVRTEPLVIRYRTFGGTATPGQDYVEVDTTFTFDVIPSLPHQTAVLEIELLDDADVEAAEYLTVRIEVESGGQVLGTDSIDFIITDDDGTIGKLLLTKDDGGHAWGTDPLIPYRIDISNLDTVDSPELELIEIVPEYTSFSAADSTPGWRCTPGPEAGSTCTLDIGSLGSGASLDPPVTFATRVADQTDPDGRHLQRSEAARARRHQLESTVRRPLAHIRTEQPRRSTSAVVHRLRLAERPEPQEHGLR